MHVLPPFSALSRWRWTPDVTFGQGPRGAKTRTKSNLVDRSLLVAEFRYPRNAYLVKRSLKSSCILPYMEAFALLHYCSGMRTHSLITHLCEYRTALRNMVDGSHIDITSCLLSTTLSVMTLHTYHDRYFIFIQIIRSERRDVIDEWQYGCLRCIETSGREDIAKDFYERPSNKFIY